jgi:hypothetical protein
MTDFKPERFPGLRRVNVGEIQQSGMGAGGRIEGLGDLAQPCLLPRVR